MTEGATGIRLVVPLDQWTDADIAQAWAEIHEIEAEIANFGSRPPVGPQHAARTLETQERTRRVLAELRARTPERRKQS